MDERKTLAGMTLREPVMEMHGQSFEATPEDTAVTTNFTDISMHVEPKSWKPSKMDIESDPTRFSDAVDQTLGFTTRVQTQTVMAPSEPFGKLGYDSWEKKGLEMRAMIPSDTELTISKKRAVSKLAPPDSGPSEVELCELGPELQVKPKRVAQKRIWIEDKESVDQATPQEKEVNGSAQMRSFVYAKRVSEVEPEGGIIGNGSVKFQARQLIDQINRKVLEPATQESMPSDLDTQRKQIMFDEDLNWSHLQDVPDAEALLAFGIFGHLKDVSADGTFGQVRLKKDKLGKYYVLKKLKRERKDSKSTKHLVEPNEIMVPFDFANSGVVARVLGLSWDGYTATILQEYAGITLHAYMKHPQYSERLKQPREVLKIVLGIFKGACFLHRHGVKHRDIKPDNLCICVKTGKVLLIDLGSSRTPQDVPRDEDALFRGSTPEFLPPNISKSIVGQLRRDKTVVPPVLTEADDVWGCAMVGLALILQALPITLHLINNVDYPQHVKKDENKFFLFRLAVLEKYGELTEPLPDLFLKPQGHPEMHKLLQGCLTLDVAKRWSAKDAVTYIEGLLYPDGQKDQKLRRMTPEAKRKVEAAFQKVQVGEPAVSREQSSVLGIQKKNPFVWQQANPGEDEMLALGVSTRGPLPPATQPTQMMSAQYPATSKGRGARDSGWHVAPMEEEEEARLIMSELVGGGSAAATKISPGNSGSVQPRVPHMFHFPIQGRSPGVSASAAARPVYPMSSPAQSSSKGVLRPPVFTQPVVVGIGGQPSGRLLGMFSTAVVQAGNQEAHSSLTRNVTIPNRGTDGKTKVTAQGNIPNFLM